jgi:hydroxyacylglutathione hydrolase
MSNMQIETIVVGPFEENCYLVYDKGDKTGVIIDPGAEEEKIIGLIKKKDFAPQAILLTHGHGDHIAAVKPLIEKFAIPLYLGRGDEIMLESASANALAMFGFQISCPAPDHLVSDQDLVTAGKFVFSVFATPGHTPGGVCYFIGKYLFCGDTLFSGSIGRTDLPGGNYEELIYSIDKNILTLPDDIICLPGHGPQTTVGKERKGNPFLTGRRFV